MSRPMVSKPKISADQADGAQRRSRARSSGGGRGSRDVGDEPRHQHEAEDADRHVDPEDPAPVEVGGDEAAERRPDHRADQRRHGELGHGASPARPWAPSAAAPAARPAPSSPRPGPAACARATSCQSESAAARTGSSRARKTTIGAAEHVPRPEAVGDPAADRDEHREAEQIGGDREAEPHRALAEAMRRSPAARSRAPSSRGSP